MIIKKGGPENDFFGGTKFQPKDRGLLREGYAADIVIFDEKEVQDISTYDKTHAYSKGFHYVIVNGVLTVDQEKHTGARAGQAIYGPGKTELSLRQSR